MGLSLTLVLAVDVKPSPLHGNRRVDEDVWFRLPVMWWEFWFRTVGVGLRFDLLPFIGSLL